jgi:hypothetical protein
MLAENAAYLEQYYGLDKRSQEDQDRSGVPVTRRKTPSPLRDASGEAEPTSAEQVAALAASLPTPNRPSSRLQGHLAIAQTTSNSEMRSGISTDIASTAGQRGSPQPSEAARSESPEIAPSSSARQRPARFNPYGSVLKCELVFPLDSVNEQMPLIGMVMEPAYNNGRLVIPAGTEVHGTARPDRLRNRLFSGEQWVLVFPREHGRINGRQLSVRGVALERAEPDINGMTWSISDGSYGIEGTVIRTMDGEEIKRFAATFLASAAAGFQTRQSNATGGETMQTTPRNAVLQGISADMQQLASDIAAEIAQHGVFIHIPAGHQFYLYPTQIIDPDMADISSDIATVK